MSKTAEDYAGDYSGEKKPFMPLTGVLAKVLPNSISEPATDFKHPRQNSSSEYESSFRNIQRKQSDLKSFVEPEVVFDKKEFQKLRGHKAIHTYTVKADQGAPEIIHRRTAEVRWQKRSSMSVSGMILTDH